MVELLYRSVNQQAKMARIVVLAAAGCLALVGTATADVARGAAAFGQGDCSDAIRGILPPAERGDATAQCYPGAKEKRMSVKRSLTRDEIFRAEGLARERERTMF
jgi:hypothetical protein